MKTFKIVALIAIAVLLTSAAFAKNQASEDRGKAIFSDTTLGNGTAGKSCSSCHADGKGLEGISSKKEWMTPAAGTDPLAERVNRCIVMALMGKALDVKGAQMKDLVSYLKSIKPKAAK